MSDEPMSEAELAEVARLASRARASNSIEAEFTIKAVDFVPRLLAEIARLRAERDRAQSEFVVELAKMMDDRDAWRMAHAERGGKVSELQAECDALHRAMDAQRAALNDYTHLAETANSYLAERDRARALAAGWQARAERAEREVEKWRTWQPDDETLAEMKKQAGDFSGKAGTLVYVRGLEAEVRRVERLESENAWMRRALTMIAPVLRAIPWTGAPNDRAIDAVLRTADAIIAAALAVDADGRNSIG